MTEFMSPPVIAACLWVLAATVTAFLPMRRQYLPGVPLLILAPVILIWLGVQHGIWITGVATLAFLSMFRNPPIYFARKAMGLPVQRPEDPASEGPEP
jgi:Protein of unknown function (DUF2484)